MEKIKHTPGPWCIEAKYPRRVIGGKPKPFERHLGQPYIADCTISDSAREPGESEANARLVAASPDLLAVARGCLGYFEDMKRQAGGDKFAPDEDWLEPLRAAINKAVGE